MANFTTLCVAKRPNPAVNSDGPVQVFVLVHVSGGPPVTLVR
jgi:hypothetical protein